MNLRDQRGYAMAALLVGMSVTAVLMTVAMPAWRQMAQREKEEELIFRGQQYARAIGLFQRRAGPGVLPPNVDTLVDQHFLRKKYKDPITGGDFELLTPANLVVQAPSNSGNSGGRSGSAAASGAPSPTFTTAGGGGLRGGGLMGVASKSKAESIRIYNGRTRYNEWQFVFLPQQTMGAPGGTVNPVQGPGRGGPTNPGGLGSGQGDRGFGIGGSGSFGTAPFGRGDMSSPPDRSSSPFQNPERRDPRGGPGESTPPTRRN